jgi:hypothetical protein
MVTATDDQYVRWYSKAVWFGICANLAFCLTAWFAPARILKLLKLEPTPRTMWLRNVGMLLVLVSMFNAGAAVAPRRYPLFSWMVPIARLIASFFFFQIVFKDLRSSTERPKSYIPLMLFDFTMGVICSVLLYRGRVGLGARSQ